MTDKELRSPQETGAACARPLENSKWAARTMGISVRTVTRLCERGEIKAVKVGAQWRINRDALLEYAGLN